MLLRAWSSRRGRELLHDKLSALGSDPALQLLQTGAVDVPGAVILAERMGGTASAWKVHAAAATDEGSLAQVFERLRLVAARAGASALVAEVPDAPDCAPWIADLTAAGFERRALVPDLYADGVHCIILMHELEPPRAMLQGA